MSDPGGCGRARQSALLLGRDPAQARGRLEANLRVLITHRRAQNGDHLLQLRTLVRQDKTGRDSYLGVRVPKRLDHTA